MRENAREHENKFKGARECERKIMKEQESKKT
jgi:hypothetical protein